MSEANRESSTAFAYDIDRPMSNAHRVSTTAVIRMGEIDR
jgi:hypothetical protein